MATVKLYDNDRAPSPRRVRIFLAEKDFAIERVAVDLHADEQRGAAFLAINPRATVPALLLDDGGVITEANAICRYVEALQPEPPLFGHTPRAIAEIEQWTRRIEAEGYAAIVDAWRNSAAGFAGRPLPGLYPETRQIPALAERGRAMWDHFCDRLDAALADRAWIADDAYSFADITALVTVDFARAARLPPAIERPAIARWHAAASARPSAAA